jgi:hypothetical protein
MESLGRTDLHFMQCRLSVGFVKVDLCSESEEELGILGYHGVE